MRRTQDAEMDKAARLLQQAQTTLGGEAQQLVQETMASAEKLLQVEREKSLSLAAEKQQVRASARDHHDWKRGFGYDLPSRQQCVVPQQMVTTQEL